jgi:hypothetical protein
VWDRMTPLLLRLHTNGAFHGVKSILSKCAEILHVGDEEVLVFIHLEFYTRTFRP